MKSILVCFFLCLLISVNVKANSVIIGETKTIQGVSIEAIDPACFTQPLDKELFYDLASSNITINLNNRTFIKKLMRKGLDRKSNNYSKIQISLNNIDCTLDGEYRLTGDLRDHFSGELSSGEFMISEAGYFHSIKVKLSNGSIDNIEKFKLFVPASRFGESEVIVTHLFSTMGFLAPRTAMVNVLHAGVKRRLIFQEDIEKGLFEHNNVHENFLFEGDEQYSLGLAFSMPVIVNDRLLTSLTKLDLANYIYHDLSMVYLKSGLLDPRINNELDRNTYFVDPILTPDFFPLTSRDEITLFSMLSYATNTYYGLSKDDSRFIYDHISRRFRPIYYDGHAEIYLPMQRGNAPFSFDKRHKKELIKKLKSINRQDFINNLRRLGVEAPESKIENFLDSVLLNIEKLTAAKLQTVNFEDEINNIMSYWKNLEDLDGTKVLNDIGFVIKYELNAFKRCNQNSSFFECNKIEFEIEKLELNKSLLTQDLTSIQKNLTETVYLGNISSDKYFDRPKLQSVIFNEIPETTFFHSKGISILLNAKKQHIVIKNSSLGDKDQQVSISGGVLKGWKIHTSEGTRLGYPFNENDRLSNSHLTGCITFSDIELLETTISIGPSNCEDALHFVRVLGRNIKVLIQDARSDALDADFSNIFFSSLDIFRAGNDCIDMSSGTYLIQTAVLMQCGDKGISGGEKSKIKITNVSIDGSLLGIVSKDSSIVDVKKFSISNTPVCLAAYRKKKEFLGGTINFDQHKCVTKNLEINSYQQPGSYITKLQN